MDCFDGDMTKILATQFVKELKIHQSGKECEENKKEISS
jgi:hypothetical protein